mmetsp:Transcript_33657/g.70617  ORF Transcript_33657/g.70617 Transcript_33657/m.70617 type:complete len:298 (+) Transcript_33657:219-1112(+)
MARQPVLRREEAELMPRGTKRKRRSCDARCGRTCGRGPALREQTAARRPQPSLVKRTHVARDPLTGLPLVVDAAAAERAVRAEATARRQRRIRAERRWAFRTAEERARRAEARGLTPPILPARMCARGTWTGSMWAPSSRCGGETTGGRPRRSESVSALGRGQCPRGRWPAARFTCLTWGVLRMTTSGSRSPLAACGSRRRTSPTMRPVTRGASSPVAGCPIGVEAEGARPEAASGGAWVRAVGGAKASTGRSGSTGTGGPEGRSRTSGCGSGTRSSRRCGTGRWWNQRSWTGSGRR